MSHQSKSYDVKPCPACGKHVKRIHAYCGYCGQQLQIQCPRCQVWTLFGHQVCPECGVALHVAYRGLTTEQEGQLQALKRQHQAIDAECKRVRDHRADLSVELRSASLRMVLVLSLLLGGCVVVINLFQGLTSTFVGVIALIALAWMFRFMLPGMARSLWRMVRWALPEIEPLRHALAEEKRSLRDLEHSACEIRAHIATLEAVGCSRLPERDEETASEEEEAEEPDEPGDEAEAELDPSADAEETGPGLPEHDDLDASDNPSNPETLPAGQFSVRACLSALATKALSVVQAARRQSQQRCTAFMRHLLPERGLPLPSASEQQSSASCEENTEEEDAEDPGGGDKDPS